jgi:hypothetical protein
MSTITRPTQFIPRACTLTLSTNQRVSASPFGGSEQAVDMLNDRWMLSCDLPPSSHAGAAWIEAFIASMRGQVNVVALYHFARPQPRGTARGTMLINGAVAQGASSISIDGISPSTGTLLAGDMLAVGGQLFMVAADVTASGGAATVSIVNRVRTAIADNASVTWDRPTALFRLVSSPSVAFAPGLATPTGFDFAEAIS